MISHFMSLFVATLLFGALILAKGGSFLWKGNKLREPLITGLRADVPTYILFVSAILWFLWEVWTMGQAEAVFGPLTRPILLIAGIAVGIGSFRWVRDFLAVRAAAALALLAAGKFLDAAFLEDPPSRLVMVTGVYVMIVAALYFGTVPYRARDFLEWLFEDHLRPRIFGGLLAIYGIALVGVALTY